MDICTRADIELLVDQFYKKVINDEVIGFFFTQVVKLDWDHHIPTMYDFWESNLLGNPTYKGNPMAIHKHLNEKHNLSKVHFDRWLELFHDTVDELFTGEKAELAKSRATSIATLIQIKIQPDN